MELTAVLFWLGCTAIVTVVLSPLRYVPPVENGRIALPNSTPAGLFEPGDHVAFNGPLIFDVDRVGVVSHGAYTVIARPDATTLVLGTPGYFAHWWNR